MATIAKDILTVYNIYSHYNTDAINIEEIIETIAGKYVQKTENKYPLYYIFGDKSVICSEFENNYTELIITDIKN